MRFRVELDNYRGPLDLLVYLVRKQELEAIAVQVSRLAEQFLHHIDRTKAVDVNSVGEFLEMASTLMEIKSRMALPGEEESEEPLDDPRNELVRRLLQFKQYRDAASMLDEQGRAWRHRYPRLANDLPERRLSPGEQPIRDVELWDLVSAFARLVQDRQRIEHGENIRYDETPIQVFMETIYARLREAGRTPFHELFQDGTHRSTLIGMFLAVLELLKHGCVQANQSDLFGVIWMEPGDKPLPTAEDLITDYETGDAQWRAAA